MRKKTKIMLIGIVSILTAGNIALLSAGNYFYDVVMTYNITNKYSQEFYDKTAALVKFDQTAFDSLQKDYVTVKSRYGYELKGIFIKNPEPSDDTVIIVHGICMDKNWSCMKYASIFLKRGYNIFVYDSRNHGESGGAHPSYGYYEKEDLDSCISYVKSRNLNGSIGIHSESLGASSAFLYAEEYSGKNEISFIIEDSGYSDLKELFTYKAGEYNIPVLLRPIIVKYMSFVCMIRSGFFLGDVSPIKEIEKVTIPVLFIHGDSDNFTPPQMAIDMYNKKTGTKALYVAAGAGHAESLNLDIVKYYQVVNDFLDEALKK
jgi:fermentation-respiration switch protein FrsA (DUF1100 family)